MELSDTKQLTRDCDYRIDKSNIHQPLKYGKHCIHQIGRMHCNKRTLIPTHIQLNYIELTVATDGRARVITNGAAADIRAGDIYISFPGDFHEIKPDKISPLKFDYVTIMTEDETFLTQLENIIASRHGADARIIRSEHLRGLVARVINEINNPDEFTSTVIESLINQIIVAIIRGYGNSDIHEPIGNATESKLLCLTLMNYIDTHIYTIKSLKELANISNYSYNYTSNLFKRITSETLSDYYQNRRLETAMLLLQSGEFSVTGIAEMLNYSSIYSFSLAFKKRYGYPPSTQRPSNDIL